MMPDLQALLHKLMKGAKSETMGEKIFNSLQRYALILVLICGCIVFSQSGCTRQENVIKIGGVGPVTGGAATYGVSTRNAFLMAVEEINQQGGIEVAGQKYTVDLIFEDDEGRPESAANAYRKLIDQDKVTAIVGTVMSKCSLAGAPIAQEAHIPMISSASTNPQVTLVGDYIFRACFIDPFQGTIMANFAFTSLGKRKAAVLFDNGNDYNKGLAEFFKARFEELGGQIAAYEAFTDEDKTQDFSAQLTKIKAADPDILFLPNYYSSVAMIAKQARAMGVTVPLIGTDGWDSPQLMVLGKEAVNGNFFSTHFSKDDPTPQVQKFVNAYTDKYHQPPDALAALAYDACLVLFEGLRTSKSLKGENIRDALKNIKDFPAISGQISFDAQRNPIKSAVIIKVEEGKQVFYQRINP
ncbi:MAG: ABC transporter substrate-binding protein [bacterium]